MGDGAALCALYVLQQVFRCSFKPSGMKEFLTFVLAQPSRAGALTL
jgi:hypothetical protein